ncbi:unnamed protein product [Kuraishia capsulata CBS 1993]|uniref:AB hydrolase-1 domain-containing protein n=1 Tax=Kuraishia capsulata CBS 1993 TaxID=1382522 RepID=W6MK88_9ASCO|nr:uncharacterized protein KUCA_T00002385001 [Kuraishia capsulata CBS 1993]CDK26413.1 unnamed protein product [Kuraishia capsulata CBS 1993]
MATSEEAVNSIEAPLTFEPKITYLDSFKHWCDFKSLAEYEKELLSYLPFYPKSDSTRQAEILDTKINSTNYIHEFHVQNTEETREDRHIVMVHGYGAALGFFYKNFDGLSKMPGVQLHAIDLLGYGLSSRPHFPKFGVDTPEDIHKSEDFFIDAIEAWRKERGLEKFVLMGHSLGGYLSSCYALKYGEGVVQKLILVSPVGVERNDFSLIGGYSAHQRNVAVDDTTIAQQQGVAIENEYLEGQRDIVADDVSISSSGSSHSERLHQVRRAPKLGRIFTTMWERNVSPFSFLRALGPFAPKLVSNWTFNRFGAIEDPLELMTVHHYTYKTFAAKGSGEFALTRILAPGAVARLPLLDRLPGKLKIPSIWYYGDHDWMSKSDGRLIVKEINEASEDGKLAKYRILSNAGHHVYLDNPPDFERSVRNFLGW